MEPITLSEFLKSLDTQGVSRQSTQAANVSSGTPITLPEFSSKVELHNSLIEHGLNPFSPLFNRLWSKHADKLPLRKPKE
jgi:hypothetical protein